MIARAVRSPAAARLRRWPAAFAGLPVVVWGDFMLDEYWRCQTRRVSREAPVLVLDFEQRTVQGGGAANAALNLAALGARVTAVGWVGRDAAGRELRAQLKQRRHRHGRADDTRRGAHRGQDAHRRRRPSHRAPAGGAGGSRRAVRAAARPTRRALLSALDAAAREARAVVLSDYGYDSVTPVLARRRVAAWRRRRVTVGLDARYRLAAYRGVTLATPNESEAAAAAQIEIRDERDLARCAQRLRRTLGATHLVITRGRDGLTLWNREAVSLAAWGGEEAVDVTGAGRCGRGHRHARAGGGRAGARGGGARQRRRQRGGRPPRRGAGVGRRGAGGAGRLARRDARVSGAAGRILDCANRCARVAERWRAAGERVVLANGVFDLLHVGHVRYLAARARARRPAGGGGQWRCARRPRSRGRDGRWWRRPIAPRWWRRCAAWTRW